MNENSYYEILGIDETATKEEIKKAYIDKIKKFHPDINKNGEEITKKLNEAYQYLMINYEGIKNMPIKKEETIFEHYSSDRDKKMNKTPDSNIKYINYKPIATTIKTLEPTTVIIEIKDQTAFLTYYIENYILNFVSIKFRITSSGITEKDVSKALDDFILAFNDSCKI